MAFPILLSGNSLGKRQRELNEKVNDAADKKVRFEEIKDSHEQTDVDRLFKIDLASKYKNIHYIVETLKCGDTLYITRALHCAWLYDDEFAKVIDPDYICHNLFPSMSPKMQRKLLTEISLHVRNPERNEAFYNYCMTSNLPKIAQKFLVFTSDEFKMHMIKEQHQDLESLLNSREIVDYVIGDNITLAECYLSVVLDQKRRDAWPVLHLLRQFYFIDPKLYLGWIVKYLARLYCRTPCLGSRISKDIMTKNKQQVKDNISIYYEILNMKTFLKYTTADEAKQYLIHFSPETDIEFFNNGFYNKYSHLFDLINEEHYHFMKKLFMQKYPGCKFEMSDRFKYQYLMSVEEREAWALRHLEKNENLSVRDQDYSWYEYVRFDIALEPIKKIVLAISSAEERDKVVRILLKCTRSLSDVEKLLKYYHQRFMNEEKTLKERFILSIINKHNVFDFTDSCWQVFQDILYSLEVYNPDETVSKNETLTNTALIYYIVNNIEIKDTEQGILKFEEDLYTNIYEKWCLSISLDKLSDDKLRILNQFLFNQIIRGLEEYKNKPCEDHLTASNIEIALDRTYILQEKLNISDEDLPVIVEKLQKVTSAYRKQEEKTDSEIPKPPIKQAQLIRILKKDAAQTVEKWPNVRYKINTFLKKLRVYFMHDIAQKYMKIFEDCLPEITEKKLLVVYGILQIADTKYKTDFLKRYLPTNAKINHREINRSHLYVQEGICRFAGYSRPPVPLSLMRKYMNGDYLQYCLPIFDMYKANLRPAEFQQFVESLLNSPVSVQKHAIRLAFTSLAIEKLKSLIKRVWQKSKNISLRMAVYDSLYRRITQQKVDDNRDELLKCLLELTLEVHEDDHSYVLDLLTGKNKVRHNPPRNIRSRGRRNHRYLRSSQSVQTKKLPDLVYVEVAWKAINNFPNKPKNTELRVLALNNIRYRMEHIDKTVIKAIVDDYFNTLFNKNGIAQVVNYNEMIGDDYNNVFEAKRSIVMGLIDDGESIESSIELVRFVIQNCFKMWNETVKRENPSRFCYCARQYCDEFIENVIQGKMGYRNQCLESILTKLQNVLPLDEIYMRVWQLRLMMLKNTFRDEHSQLASHETHVFEEYINNFSVKVCELVAEFKAKQSFCLAFLDDISIEIIKTMEGIYCNIRDDLNSYDIRVMTAIKLVDVGEQENILLAVKIMPDVGLCCSYVKWKVLLQKLEAYDSLEVKSLLHMRFARAGYNFIE